MVTREVVLWALAGGMTVVVLATIMLLRGPIVRYVLAMVFAAAFALFSSVIVSSRVASYVVDHMRFDSPDGAGAVHMYTFLGTSVAALAVGWAVGWLLGGPFAGRSEPR